MIKKEKKLKSGVSMPVLGLGTWQLEGETARQAVKTALECGYRHIDTADVYKNHQEVGEGIQASKIDRNEIFITTKIKWDDLSRAGVEESVPRFLAELGIGYIDQLLIHWPNKKYPIKETLGAMADFQKQGKVRSVGVSNFTIHHLEDIEKAGFEIDINQVEFHPSLNQLALKEYCDARHIAISAYSPLAQGEDLALPIIQELAKKYSSTPAQIILNWLLAKGMVVLPRSQSREHIIGNLEALNFELNSADQDMIDKISTEQLRVVNPGIAEFDY